MLSTGDILKKERIKLGLSLEDVEKTTRIRKKNLEAIELSQWEKFDSKTYILGIIKTYGKFLNLNQEKLSAFFRREYEQKENPRFKQRLDKETLTPQKKKNFKYIIILIFLLFLFYFGYQIKLYITPPTVTILEPTRTTFKVEDSVKLVGRTEKDASITINGNKVYPDNNYVFSTVIPLNNKINSVLIEVVGANGKKTVIKKEFIKE